MTTNLAGVQNKEKRVEIEPSMPACSKAAENCVNSSCCQVSGHKCFTEERWRAQCNETRKANIAAAQTAETFACEQWNVFSDVSAHINTNGYVTIKAEDTKGEFHQLKQTDSGTWVNWPIFYEVWFKIREVGKWQAADYTIENCYADFGPCANDDCHRESGQDGYCTPL